MNIEGIEILNKIEIVKTVFPGWVGWITLIGCIIVFLIGIIFAIKERDGSWVIIAFFINILFVFMMIIFGDVNQKKVPTGRYRYEVTMSDDVNFKEVYEKYELVETRGEIFVFEDKE